MRLRATIVIDIDAADFVEAAEHQQQIEQMLAGVREIYGRAELELRERRVKRRTIAPVITRTVAAPSGRLKTYVD